MYIIQVNKELKDYSLSHVTFWQPKKKNSTRTYILSIATGKDMDQNMKRSLRENYTASNISVNISGLSPI